MSREPVALMTLKSGAMGGRGDAKSSCKDDPASPFEQAVMQATVTQLERALAWLIKNPNVHGCAKARQDRIRRRLDEIAKAFGDDTEGK